MKFNIFKKFFNSIKLIMRYVYTLFVFIVILILYTFFSIFTFILLPIIKKEGRDSLYDVLDGFSRKINIFNKGSISILSLIEISLRHLETKKARTFVTIGGMALGIGGVVLLLSIGYGLQELVNTKVATYQQLRQADVASPSDGKLVLNDKTIADIKNQGNISDIQPLIAAVGEITYKGSNTDIVSYAVTTNYLKNSDATVIRGRLFDSNNIVVAAKDIFSLPVFPTIPLLSMVTSSTPTSTPIPTLNQIDLPGGSGNQVDKVNDVEISENALKQAVVNQSMLSQLGIDKNVAVGTKFSVSYKIPKSANNNASYQSNQVDYTIVGVLADTSTPIFYIPFIDLRSLGISNYSQLRVTVDDGSNLTQVREKINALGYTTSSAIDTKNQINSLFSIIQVALFAIGMIGLSIAALGMFNTLTISLLERTREVGLMKAVGMKSEEIRELFLTESMMMGVLGGVSGLILGYIGGQILNMIIFFLLVQRIPNIINITYIPGYFIAFILILSVVVGLLTGIFPARRTSSISVLDTLRYE